MWASHDSNACECCAASCSAAPLGPRNTIGMGNWPPDMYSILAATFTTWSMASSAKFHVMNSMIGRRPHMAAPTPTPAKPSSVMGVSTTRISPNSWSSPLDTL